MLNDLVTAVLIPSEAETVNVDVSGFPVAVPEIKPDEERDNPVGKDPDVTEYVIVFDSSSVADNWILDPFHVPSDPEDVAHTGESLIKNASGSSPNRFEGFIILIS